MKIFSFLIFFMLLFNAWGHNTEKPMDEKNVTIEMIDMDFDEASADVKAAMDHEFGDKEKKPYEMAPTLQEDLISNEIVPMGLISPSGIESLKLQLKLPYANSINFKRLCSRCLATGNYSNPGQFDFG